jgi:hypothetical protein
LAQFRHAQGSDVPESSRPRLSDPRAGRHTPPVPLYRIDSERSRIDVTARPSLPGVRLVVDEVTGSIELPDQEADGGPAAGPLTVWLQALLDDGPRAEGLPPWLRNGEPVPADGHIESARCPDDDHLEVVLRLTLAGRVVPVTGAGRIRRRDGVLEAVGVSVVDPRVLGFNLPPLVTYALHTRWILTLTPG